MIFAAFFGMMSSALTRLNPLASNITFCVEIHMFVLQAATSLMLGFATNHNGVDNERHVMKIGRAHV